MIKTVLTIKHVYHSSVNRLYDYNTRIEIRLLVCIPNYPVYKCS